MSAAVDLCGEALLGELARDLAIGRRRPELPAEDLGARPAERAEPAGGGLATLLARRALGRVLVREQVRGFVEVAEEELRLRPRRSLFDRVHRVLVAKLRVAADERALL